MRRSRLAKQRKVSGTLFVCAIFGISLGMLGDLKSGVMFEDFKVIVEKDIENIFLNARVDIGNLEKGIFRRLILDDLKITHKDMNEKEIPFISVDRVIVKHTFKELVLNKQSGLDNVYLISPIFYARFTGGGSETKQLFANNLTRPASYSILNGKITDLGSGLVLTDLKGKVEFRDYNLAFKNLTGRFFDIPIVINGHIKDLDKEPLARLRISFEKERINGKAHIKSWRNGKGFSISGFMKYLDRFSVPYKGKINITPNGIFKLKDLVIGDRFVLNGEYDFQDRACQATLKPDNGQVTLSGSFPKDGDLESRIKLSHLKFFNSDVISDIFCRIKFSHQEAEGKILQGELWTQNVILNYKPFKDIKVSFVLKTDELIIKSIELGEEYKFFGSIDLNKPYQTNMSLAIDGADLSEWTAFTYSQDMLSGIMFGDINISGPLKNPITKGRLEFRDGNIQEVNFDVINIKIAGEGHILAINDSRIFKEGGFLIISGMVDLSKLGKRNIFEDLTVETDQKVIVWEGWDVAKDNDTSEVSLGKDINEDFKIRFKGYTERDLDGYDRKSEIGLDYKIERDDSLNMRMREDGAFVGVEHKVKF